MPPKRAPRLASIRYRQLIDSMGTACASAYGWRQAAADTLGIRGSYLTKLYGGRQEHVGVATIDRARERFNLGAYFEEVDDALAAETAKDAVRGWRDRSERHAAKERTSFDEFDVLRALEALGAPARARVRAWLEARDAQGGVT